MYLITCKVYRLQYIGSTRAKFRLKFNNHKSSLGAHSSESTVDRECNDFICRHFHGPEYRGLQDVGIRIISGVRTEDGLVVKEGEWAYSLQTLRPDGLNDGNFFYSQGCVAGGWWLLIVFQLGLAHRCGTRTLFSLFLLVLFAFFP